LESEERRQGDRSYDRFTGDQPGGERFPEVLEASAIFGGELPPSGCDHASDGGADGQRRREDERESEGRRNRDPRKALGVVLLAQGEQDLEQYPNSGSDD